MMMKTKCKKYIKIQKNVQNVQNVRNIIFKKEEIRKKQNSRRRILKC